MAGTSGDDQIVVAYAGSVAKNYCIALEVELDSLAQHNLDIFVAVKDSADWLGNLARAQDGSCDLVKQRLKDVVISPVDYNNVHSGVCQRFRGPKPAKTGSDYDDFRPFSFSFRHILNIALWLKIRRPFL
jgi:hypothetical protein